MCWFSKAAITKYHILSALHNRDLSCHNSGDWKPKIKVLAALVPSEGCEEKACSRCLSGFWCTLGNLWCSLACRTITLISLLTSIWCLPSLPVSVHIVPFYKEHQSYWIRAYFNEFLFT